jgi:hypothetical protein
MAVTSEPDNSRLPGTVFTPRQVRLLKVAVIVMGILLVGGFALVLATIVYQASRLGEVKEASIPRQAGMPVIESELVILPGTTITSLSLDGDRLALHLSSAAGAEIAVVDIKTGKVVSRLKLKSQ